MDTDNPLTYRFRGCMLGLAVGDAVGTSTEFKQRGSFEPVTDMEGGGPFDLDPGEWTDETSMALCLAASLLVRDGFDPADQMKRYRKWQDSGYMSSTGGIIDPGITVRSALARFAKTGNPFAGSTNPNSAGNASLMRLAPVPMFYFGNREEAIRYSGESSRTTHGAAECIDGCRYLGLVIHRALSGAKKEDVVAPGPQDLVNSPRIQALAQGSYQGKGVDDISASAQVVDSLEAALWCFWHTDSYADAVLAAANLGEDADTIAAICGQLAGAFYGVEDIPQDWRDKLVMRDGIAAVADRLLLKASSY